MDMNRVDGTEEARWRADPADVNQAAGAMGPIRAFFAEARDGLISAIEAGDLVWATKIGWVVLKFCFAVVMAVIGIDCSGVKRRVPWTANSAADDDNDKRSHE